MDRKKAFAFVLVFACILQIFTVPCAHTASAAVKKGLQKESGRTYYYKSGKKVKGKWITAQNGTYYFGKDGAAYKGYKKVGKGRYYFDGNCKMVSNKAVKISGKKYFFCKNGKAPQKAALVNGKVWKTSSGGRLLKKAGSLAKVGKSFDALQNMLGTPYTAKVTPSCNGVGNDGIYEYDNFAVYTYEENGSRSIVYIGELVDTPQAR